MIKYIKNLIITAVICIGAMALGSANNKNVSKQSNETYDPCVISNITHNIEMVERDIEHITDDIMKCHVNIKFANRCRHGYCYDDIEYLEKDLNNYRKKLRNRKYELYCLSKLLSKESEKPDNGIL